MPQIVVMPSGEVVVVDASGSLIHFPSKAHARKFARALAERVGPEPIGEDKDDIGAAIIRSLEQLVGAETSQSEACECDACYDHGGEPETSNTPRVPKALARWIDSRGFNEAQTELIDDMLASAFGVEPRWKLTFIPIKRPTA